MLGSITATTESETKERSQSEMVLNGEWNSSKRGQFEIDNNQLIDSYALCFLRGLVYLWCSLVSVCIQSNLLIATTIDS